MAARSHRGISQDRGAFTLIELLIVISIIGVLAGLLVPAVMNAREAGRRTLCLNNMQQLGKGLLGYLTAHGTFPKAGTFEEFSSADRTNPMSSNKPSVIWGAINDPGSLSAADQERCLSNWVVEILPFIDHQEEFNNWDREQPYFSTVSSSPDKPNNLRTSSTSIGALTCPDDPSVVSGQGNLSYVVNGGFSRWHAITQSWTPPQFDGDPQGGVGDKRATGKGPLLTWGASSWQTNQQMAKKLGVMFLGTQSGGYPWDTQIRPQNIEDGTSSTLLLTENVLAGASRGNTFSGQLPTNWACPLPNFCMFLGPDAVCDRAGCTGGQLMPVGGDSDGPGWVRANLVGTYANINYGQTLTVEGSFPYANSGHPGGINVAFCDGTAKFISSTIDGTVYSKIITSAGGRLPINTKQILLDQDLIR